ncbi:MAG: hypothetical protein QM578_26435 [Pantoea sp.]|uniref:hypothetical protein n=1 Tax=Pantoea sp. TaxID=69393 RepID=UPI0039E28856
MKVRENIQNSQKVSSASAAFEPVFLRPASNKMDAAGSPLSLAGEYSDVLHFAERYDARLRRQFHIEQNSAITDLAHQARLALIMEGQSCQIPPRELKEMLASSSRDALCFSDIPPDPEAETRHSLMAGVSRKTRII